MKDREVHSLAKAAKTGGVDMTQAAQQLSMGGGPDQTPGAGGVLNRLKEAAAYVVSGVTPKTWFGPWQPIKPMADQPEQGAIGRQFDFPVGFNTKITPRQDEPVGFSTLRAFGDNYDLLRLAIETCKDQLEAIEWEIVPEDEEADETAYADEIRRVSNFLEYPDREHNWQQWFRMIVEDMLVIDAVAIFPTKTRGGGLYSLDLVDGATITRVIDQYGRTPMPPDPAYRQILHGVPAVNYTRDELIYIVRNPRTNRLYGYGPVEQVMMTTNIAIRRQLRQLDEYTEGTIPDALASLPDTWTSQQIKDFQDWFDTILSGNSGQRRKMRFLPATEQILFPKANPLKDEYDEWLARIICWAFSITPTALIKAQNRAVSEQMSDTAKEEGQGPRLRFLAGQINALLRNTLGMRGVKFKWKTAKAMDPLVQAQIDGVYLQNGVRTPEMQQRLSIDELPPPPDPIALLEAQAKVTQAKQAAEPQPTEEPGEKPAEEPQPAEEPAVAQKLAKLQDDLIKALSQQPPINVTVNPGDTYVRVLPADVNVTVPERAPMSKTVRASRDPKTGELVGVIDETQ